MGIPADQAKMPKTALALTHKERSSYAPDRNQGQGCDTDRFMAAWEIVPRLAARLRTEFGATQVVVFGSLLNPSAYTRWSDIDLAACDIAPARFYQAIGCLNDMAKGFQVDLVDPSSNGLCNSVKQRIAQFGIEV